MRATLRGLGLLAKPKGSDDLAPEADDPPWPNMKVVVIVNKRSGSRAVRLGLATTRDRRGRARRAPPARASRVIPTPRPSSSRPPAPHSTWTPHHHRSQTYTLPARPSRPTYPHTPYPSR